MADPAPIVHTLMTDLTIFTQFRLQGVVTSVDAVHVATTLSRHPESQKQVGVADLLLLTKLVDAAALTALKQRLQKLSPSARWLTPVAGTLEPSAILALDQIEPVQSATLLNQWLDVKPVSKVKFSAATPGRLFMGEMQTDAPDLAGVNQHDDRSSKLVFLPTILTGLSWSEPSNCFCLTLRPMLSHCCLTR